jgi:sec-independent protein translocase protein TatA
MPFIDNIVQPTHLLVILAVALLVLGPKRLPEVGRSVGRSIRDFRGAVDDVKVDLSDRDKPADRTTPVAPAAERRA